MKKNIIALSLITLSICTHSCAMEEQEREKQEHIKEAVGIWENGGQEKSTKNKSKSHIVKRKNSNERKSKSHIAKGTGGRRQSGSDFVNTVEGMRHSAGEIPCFNQEEKKRTFSFGKSFKGLSGSPLSPRKQPRERAKSATELDLRVLLVLDSKAPLTPTTPRKKTFEREWAKEEKETEKQRRESVERKMSASNISAAKMLLSRKAKLRRSNYAGNRKGRDSQTDFSSQQYLGKNALELFDADTTEGSSIESPRTGDDITPRTDSEADPFEKSSEEEKNNNNSTNTSDEIQE